MLGSLALTNDFDCEGGDDFDDCCDKTHNEKDDNSEGEIGRL